MKYSKQRELIFNYLCDNKIHPTADTVYSSLKSDNPSLSLGTVYRNLNQLSESGDILKIQIPNMPDRFDSTVHKHFHFVCTECGNVYDISQTCIPKIDEKVIEGNKILSYDLNMQGICKNCLEK